MISPRAVVSPSLWRSAPRHFRFLLCDAPEFVAAFNRARLWRYSGPGPNWATDRTELVLCDATALEQREGQAICWVRLDKSRELREVAR